MTRANRAATRRAVDDYESQRSDLDAAALIRDGIDIPKDAIEIIRDRLQAAARLIERSTGRAGPAAYGSSWPPILREWADLLAQEEGQSKDRERNRVTLQATANQVGQAEQCMAWRRYVAGEPLVVLNLWLRAKALRRPWQAEAVRRGIPRETAKRRLQRALFLIAAGLARDAIPIEEARR